MNVAIFRTCRSALLLVPALPSVAWGQPCFTADLGYANADFSLGGFNFFDDNLCRFAVSVGWALQWRSG